MKKFAAILLALVMALSLCSVSWATDVTTTAAVDLTKAENWSKDRTEPENWTITNNEISFKVKEQPAADNWYAYQGRGAATGYAASNYWAVSYTLDVTAAMMETANINTSVWIQIDKNGGNTVASQKDCVDWAIVQFINKGSDGAAWQWWNSAEEDGGWKDIAAVAPTQGSHSIKTEFSAGTVRHYIDGTKVAEYTLEETATAPALLIAQGRSYGSAFDVKVGVPTISVTKPAPSGGGYYYAGPSISAVLNGPNKSATDYTSGDYGLIFRSTASYSGFTGVQVDGKALAKGNYTVEDNGGTEVYLKAAYLKTLAAGKHTVTILSTAGNVSMDFTIGGKTTAPQTFDAGVGIYAVTAVLSLGGMAWTAKKRH